jgi:hypothetical protein
MQELLQIVNVGIVSERLSTAKPAFGAIDHALGLHRHLSHWGRHP